MIKWEMCPVFRRVRHQLIKLAPLPKTRLSHWRTILIARDKMQVFDGTFYFSGARISLKWCSQSYYLLMYFVIQSNYIHKLQTMILILSNLGSIWLQLSLVISWVLMVSVSQAGHLVLLLFSEKKESKFFPRMRNCCILTVEQTVGKISLI